MELNTQGYGNIENINSKYIILEIFSFLFENKKLELLSYNKKLQKFFDLTLDDYKTLTQRYKILDNNGKGKEYIINTNILLFEGEYKNAKKNGIGKEYNINGKLIFEGEYENGLKKNGKGYDNKGNIYLTVEN